MLDNELTELLEQIATTLREILEINPKTILNPNHLEELSKKIEKNLEGFNIVTIQDEPYLLLENENNFTIHISGNEETRFYNLVEQLVFAITFDKKSLNYYQLQHSVFHFSGISLVDNRRCNYLKLAFMMPKKAFYSVLREYSSADGLTVYMSEMQSEVNKYCYKRGKDLNLW